MCQIIAFERVANQSHLFEIRLMIKLQYNEPDKIVFLRSTVCINIISEPPWCSDNSHWTWDKRLLGSNTGGSGAQAEPSIPPG